MGNRAVITTEKAFMTNSGTGIYLHWNGGRDSVEAFLKYCKLRGFRRPEDSDYGWARLCQVIANFMGGEGLSVGIGDIKQLDTDNYDNGTYLIRDWEIVGRKYLRGEEQYGYKLEDFLIHLDNCQPEQQRLGKDMILSLLKNNRNISEVTWNYDYLMKKRAEEGISPKGFEKGRFYSSERNGGDIVQIIEKHDYDVLAEFEDGTRQELPLFRWLDGCETLVYGEGYDRKTIDSLAEVSS